MTPASDAAGGAASQPVVQGNGGPQLLVIGRIGGRAVALPGSAVERILPMASITMLPDLPPSVVGVLDIHGAILPVVDARAGLGAPPTQPAPQQHLVVMAAATRYLLWMDMVDRAVSVPAESFSVVDGDAQTLSRHVVRFEGEVIPVLSPESLDPGRVVHDMPGVR